jgi:hypothetical protein
MESFWGLSYARKATCFSLDKTKIKTIYGVVVPDYEESLRKFMGLLQVKSELWVLEEYDFRFISSLKEAENRNTLQNRLLKSYFVFSFFLNL